MQIGISTGCLYPMLTEDSIRTLTVLGFRQFEIFFNAFSELEPDYLDRLRGYLEQNGAGVASVHPFTSSFESLLLFSAYERRFEDGIRFYEQFFRTAQRLGADKVILHGLNTNYPSALPDSEYFRRFRLMQERAACYGVTLLQENVRNFRSRDPAFIERMAAALPDHAAFVLDVKQAAAGGIDPLTMAQTMGTRLRHIHISDTAANGQCVLPGYGCYDFRPLIQYLRKIHYSGSLILEVYRFSFQEINDLLKSCHFLDALIHET